MQDHYENSAPAPLAVQAVVRRASATEWPEELRKRAKRFQKRQLSERREARREQHQSASEARERARLARHQRRLARLAERRAARKADGLQSAPGSTWRIQRREAAGAERRRRALAGPQGNLRFAGSEPASPAADQAVDRGEGFGLDVLLKLRACESDEVAAIVDCLKSADRWLAKRALRWYDVRGYGFREAGIDEVARLHDRLRSDQAAFRCVSDFLRANRGLPGEIFRDGEEGGRTFFVENVGLDLLAERLLEVGIRFAGDVLPFMTLANYAWIRSRVWGSSKQVPLDRVGQLARNRVLRELPLSDQKVLVYSPAHLTEERMGSPRGIRLALKAWRIEPSFPKRIAERLGRHFGASPSRLHLAAGVLRGMDDDGLTDRREFAAVFWQRFAQALKAPRMVRAAILWRGSAWRRALYVAYGALSRPVEEALGTVFRSALKDGSMKVLPSFKVGALAAILHTEHGGAYAQGAVRLAVTFGSRWKEWLSKPQNRGRSFHDLTYWLPLGSQQAGLVDFLLRHASEERSSLSVVADAWDRLSDGDRRSRSFGAVLTAVRALGYWDVRHPGFAEESAKWGLTAREFAQAEWRFIASLALADFRPEVSVQVGQLHGSFLKRDDVRGPFLGQYSSCCQHVKHPDGQACAWYGQEKPNSGFFVVRDGDGEIVAQSWAWETAQGLCFDNVEAKGLGDRDQAVAEVYLAAARTLLAKGVSMVTIGTAHGDLACLGKLGQKSPKGSPWLALPADYRGWCDSRRQIRLLAEPGVPVP